MKILFFGSAEFALPTLQQLLASRHQVVGVVAQSDKPAGRGQKITACPVAAFAKKQKLLLLQPERLDAAACANLLSKQADLLVVVAYGKFLPQSLVLGAPKGATNLHPSLLPKYRGAAPIQWAILNGDRTTGVSTMKVADEMDAGDLYLQEEFAVDSNETAETLHDRLSVAGASLISKTIDGLEKGTLVARPQDSSKVILAPKLTKEMGLLDFAEPAVVLERKVRALQPWPGTYFIWKGKKMIVHRAEVVSVGAADNADAWVVPCGQDGLRLLEVQLEGKRRMTAQEFRKGSQC